MNKVAYLSLLAVAIVCSPPAHAGDCLRDGVPALQVTAPNGASSILIGGMHSAFEGLCLPSSQVMKGAKRYVVESIAHPRVKPEETSAPAALLLEKPQPEIPPGIEHLPRSAWSKALTDREIAELRRRAECSGYPSRIAELAVRAPSASLAANLAISPCAQSGTVSRDEALARAAAAEGLTAFALETQPEANLQRNNVPPHVHEHTVYQALSSDPIPARRRAVAALNAGQYDRILAAVSSLAKSPTDAALVVRLMVTNRNEAWMPRLASYLDEGDAVVNVGAAHLAGPQGLPALLSKKGYRVKNVKLPAKQSSE